MLPASGSLISPELDFHLSPHQLTSSASIFSAPPPSQPEKCEARTCPWWPYSSSLNFKTNTALILTILFCILLTALALHAGIRYIIRQCRRSPEEDIEATGAEEQKQSSFGNLDKLELIPTMVFSPGMRLGGTEAVECTICLTEFVEGDVIRVMERCSHGFHVQCIQQWLFSHFNCPTCRASCFASSHLSSSSTNNNCQVPAEG
ncbi:hypothetical protein LIER_11070 [Lithospermum erythrorhizon]|uniref:RING-type E3 ubiquitin transferase n=1 Tax=Lithospermum erythrorhizon TaxID=34254 RepID=A0AAV3PN81_LITER